MYKIAFYNERLDKIVTMLTKYKELSAAISKADYYKATKPGIDWCVMNIRTGFIEYVA